MIKINLLPPEAKEKEIRQKQILLIGFGAGIIIGLGIIFYLIRLATNQALATKLSKLDREYKQYQTIIADVQKFKTETGILESKKNLIEGLMKGRLIYPKFIENFLELLPPQIWLTNMNTTISPDELTFSISCISYDYYAIADFIANLENPGSKFTDIEIGGIGSTGGEAPGSMEQHSFALNCKYKTKE